MQKESLENVLAVITKQTGVRFSYNSQLINPKTKITVHAQNKTIEDVLFIILPANVSYKKMGEHVVFLKKGEKRKEKGENEKMREENIEKNMFLDNGITANNCLDNVISPKEYINLLEDTVNFTKNENMKAQVAGLMLAIATASAPIAAQDTQEVNFRQTIENQQQEIISEKETALSAENLISLVAEETPPVSCKSFQLTFIYPLGTGFVKAAGNCYRLSINIIGGVTGKIKGFEAGGVFNINKHGAKGAQFAGVFNIAETGQSNINSKNVQFAGIFNVTQRGKSAQFAGIFNSGDTAYFQTAGIWNIAKKAGCQFAGIFNHGNIAHFQAAGIWNTAKQTKWQIAGIGNVAQESSCQIAGIVNVTKKGRFQMGLINVRDTADGVSLGLINIVKKDGVLEAGIEAGEFVHTAITFRSGVHRLYSIIFTGYNYVDSFWAIGTGLGTSVKLKGNLSLNFETIYTSLLKNNIRDNQWGAFAQFRPVFNYRFAKYFKIYAGPSFNLLFQTGSESHDNTITWNVKIPYSIYHTSSWLEFNYNRLDLWVGVVGGIKF